MCACVWVCVRAKRNCFPKQPLEHSVLNVSNLWNGLFQTLIIIRQAGKSKWTVYKGHALKLEGNSSTSHRRWKHIQMFFTAMGHHNAGINNQRSCSPSTTAAVLDHTISCILLGNHAYFWSHLTLAVHVTHSRLA